MSNVKYLILLLCVLFVGCTNSSNKEENLACHFVKPIPANLNLSELKDVTTPALFSSSDFNWKDGTLAMTVFSIDCYDAKAIDQMQIGDSILFRNDTIIIDNIQKDKILTINGGIEYGGVYLTQNDSDSYRVQLMDDHPQYSELGKVQLPLSKDLTIIDCGDNPTDPYDTIRTNHKQWLDNVKEYKRDFSELNTRVKIENGVITNITRFWIP